jgi:hypothetical protein
VKHVDTGLCLDRGDGAAGAEIGNLAPATSYIRFISVVVNN